MRLAGEAARAGVGCAILIAGEAGIGKTRLATEALAALGERGFATLRGRCLPEAPAPYLPIFEALKSGGLAHMLSLERPPRLEYLYLASPHGTEIASVGRAESPLDRDLFLSMLSAIESFAQDTLGGLAGGRERRLNAIGYGDWRIVILTRPFGNLVAVLRGTESDALIEAMEASLDTIEKRHGEAIAAWDGDRVAGATFAEPLRDLVGPGRFEGEEEAVDPKDRKFRVLEGLSRGLLRQSARQPIALLLDDFHLADSATVSAFQYLARSNQHSPLVLLATYRSEELIGRSARERPLTSVRAALLEEGLAVEVAVGPLDKGGLRRLIEQQMGVRDLDDDLVDALFQETRGEPFFALEVLRYLQAEGRLERIGHSVHLRGALQGGALPRQLRDAVSHRIAKLPRDERDLLECAAVDGQVFSPARVACALDLKRLRVLRALRNLEEDQHLVRIAGDAGSFEDARVREVIYDGIHADLKREYHAAVAECALKEQEAGGRDLTEAVAFHFWKARDARAKPFLLKAAERAAEASSNAEASDWYERYLGFAGDAFEERVLAGYGGALLYAGKFERAARVFETLVSRAPHSPQFFEYLRNLTEAVGHAEGFQRGLEAHERHRPKGEGLAWAKWAVQRARMALRVGQVDQAEKDANRALPILAAEGGSRLDIAEANSVLAFVGEAIGDYDMCVAFGKKAIEAAGEDLPLIAMYHNNVGIGYLFGGHYAEAHVALARALEVAEAKRDFFRVALALTNLGLLEIRRGNMGLAREHLNRGLKWAERLETPFLVGLALDFLGLCALEDGRDEEAAEYLGRARAPTDAAGDKGQMIWLRIHASQLELERGDPEQALVLASEAYELAAGTGEAPEQAMARAIIAGADGVLGESEVALKGFNDAVRGLQFSPARYEHADCLRLWGQFLVDLGKLDEAEAKLSSSLKIFTELGAAGKVASVTATLRAIGKGGEGTPLTAPAQ